MPRAHPILPCLLIFAGCVTDGGGIPFTNDFTLAIRDAPERQRFELELTAGAAPICFTIEQWPDRHGRVDTGRIAHVSTETGRFEASNENFGYCPGGCGEIRVEPRARLSAFVAYDQFPAGASLSLAAVRRLDYDFHPYSCR